MERRLEEMLPVYGVEQDCILSRQGDHTIAFRVKKPEIFTLSAEEFEGLHQAFVKSIRVLPRGSILHLQDWFLSERYAADFGGEEKSFLAGSSERFFNERPWMRHESYLFLTRKPRGRKDSGSAMSGLLRRSILPEESLDEE